MSGRFYTEALPNKDWRFSLYVNSGGKTIREIAKDTGCTRALNLGYFDMTKFRPTGGLIVGGKTLQEPEYRDWGVTVDSDGNLSRGVPYVGAGGLNWCPAVPPELKSGKAAAAAQSFGRDGTTMIGFKADGTPVWTVCLKAAGKAALPGEGATSDEAVSELVKAGCVDVLRYDGSWSTQALLADGLHVPGKYRVVYTLLLAWPRQDVKKEEPTLNNLKVMPYSLALAGSKALSANFSVNEFACHDGTDTVFIADELVTLLQKVRDHYGKPVHINSGYRTEVWNKAHNGAEQSQHKYGRAADIHIDGVTPSELAAYVETLMPSTGGIGIYSSFTHIDVRAAKSRWNG